MMKCNSDHRWTNCRYGALTTQVKQLSAIQATASIDVEVTPASSLLCPMQMQVAMPLAMLSVVAPTYVLIGLWVSKDEGQEGICSQPC